MTIMDRGARALCVYKKIVAAGGCATFDDPQLSRATTVCTLKTKHVGAHGFEAITRVLFAISGNEP
jgi:hypothetical protein